MAVTYEWMTVVETAEYLHVRERWVRRAIDEKRLSFHRIGRHIRIAKADVDDFIRSSRVEAR